MTAAPLPGANIPFINPDGTPNRQWFLYFQGIRNVTASSSGTSLAALASGLATAQATITALQSQVSDLQVLLVELAGDDHVTGTPNDDTALMPMMYGV